MGFEYGCGCVNMGVVTWSTGASVIEQCVFVHAHVYVCVCKHP